MRIHGDFVGGNIIVTRQTEREIWVENDLKDTGRDWFYWSFCAEGFADQTITFHFQELRLGYFGPAVSHDLEHWHWLNSVDGNSFTYTFGPEENVVYFAHDMLYRPDRFFRFAQTHGLQVEELCTTRKGRSLPCLYLGEGETSMLLTARHHACESTGSYVLEGVLEELLREPLPGVRILCVPFVDFDGVMEGDQGKDRIPHDHNRDYCPHVVPIYPETAAIRNYAEKHGCHYGFDFHSPWHWSAEHDHVFLVRSIHGDQKKYDRFSRILQSSLTPESLWYDPANDMKPNEGWNIDGAQFSANMMARPECRLALSMEATYAGLPENRTSQERFVELGRCMAKSIRRYRIDETETV